MSTPPQQRRSAQAPVLESRDRPPPRNDEISRRMSAQRSRDTEAELAVRRRLHGAGTRYRVHWPVPGLPRRRIDIAFTRLRIAVFIDGCYWHGCDAHCRLPTHNAHWWEHKIQTNWLRDRNTDDHLCAIGWTVLRFWEHEDPDVAGRAVLAAVRARSAKDQVRERGACCLSGNVVETPVVETPLGAGDRSQTPDRLL